MWLDNREIRFLGRDDRQVKINGFRIELGEVEAALCRSSLVKSGVCTTCEDASGRKRLVAHIVPVADGEFSNSSLRKQLHEWLPEYMIPSSFEVHNELPVTANGKIDYKRLEAEPSISGRMPTELGINSLEIIRMVNRIEEKTGSRPALVDIYQAPWEETLQRAGKAGVAGASDSVSAEVARSHKEGDARQEVPTSPSEDIGQLAHQYCGRIVAEFPRDICSLAQQMQDVGRWLEHHPPSRSRGHLL